MRRVNIRVDLIHFNKCYFRKLIIDVSIIQEIFFDKNFLERFIIPVISKLII